MTTATEDPKNPVKINRYTRSLPVTLVEGELVERARESARLAEEIADKKSSLKSYTSLAKGEIEDLENRKRTLESEIRHGKVLRPVECERRFLYRVGKVQDVRLDTGDVISDRAMTDEERQLELKVKGEEKPANEAEPIPEEPELETKKRKRGSR